MENASRGLTVFLETGVGVGRDGRRNSGCGIVSGRGIVSGSGIDSGCQWLWD